MSAVLGAEASEERGEGARLSAFVGAIAIGDLVKSTLGPRGMDKILQSVSGKPSSAPLQVTNDGATILRALHVDNPAAKVLVDLARVQDDAVGDGTTSVVVLAAELLREAERLVEHQRVHPQTVVAGYRAALAAARDALERSAAAPTGDALEAALLAIARTTLSSKILAADRDHFARIAVDAVLRVAEPRGNGRHADLERVHVLKRTGGRLADSALADGLLLERRNALSFLGNSHRVEGARVLVANTAMDADKTKVYGGRFRASGPEQLAALEAAERDEMRAKVAAIARTGANVFVNRQLVYSLPAQLLADAGILCVEHADFDGVERLAALTGARIVSTFSGDEGAVLGSAALVEEVALGGWPADSDAGQTGADAPPAVRFSGCAAGSACTIVLRGATPQMLAEAERALHDALCVLQAAVADPRTVLGGGCAEMLMAHAVDALVAGAPGADAGVPAEPIVGKQMLAVEAFARALRALPSIIAENAGLDAGELVAQLRVLHAQGFRTAGLDVAAGRVGDVSALGVVEALRMKRAVLVSAAEAAEMILRVDNILRAAPRQRTRH